jgi:hypothetical protein
MLRSERKSQPQDRGSKTEHWVALPRQFDREHEKLTRLNGTSSLSNGGASSYRTRSMVLGLHILSFLFFSPVPIKFSYIPNSAWRYLSNKRRPFNGENRLNLHPVRNQDRSPDLWMLIVLEEEKYASLIRSDCPHSQGIFENTLVWRNRNSRPLSTRLTILGLLRRA